MTAVRDRVNLDDDDNNEEDDNDNDYDYDDEEEEKEEEEEDDIGVGVGVARSVLTRLLEGIHWDAGCFFDVSRDSSSILPLFSL